jgi:DNA-binding transcriptional MerR regulator
LRSTISPKRYFTANEVENLCGLSWDLLQVLEAQLFPERRSKTQGRRRLYQHHEVLQLRRLSQQLQVRYANALAAFEADMTKKASVISQDRVPDSLWEIEAEASSTPNVDWKLVRTELLQIRALLDDIHEFPNKR